MTRARATLVSVEDTPYYHCTGRCVRRAFLCGEDRASGRCYDHRRSWMQERLALLAEVFAIDVCAYALMSNHYHLVVRLGPEQTGAWSDAEVVERWTQLYAGAPIVHKYRQGKPLTTTEQAQLGNVVSTWRERLGNLSWFMRCLNENIARRANAEDQCTGHFWEGRFKSQALLDETALIAGMAYVDLNPIRAAVATSIPGSDFTSAQDRLGEITQGRAAASHETLRRPRLLPFGGEEQRSSADDLPYNLQDYLDLLDETGRMIRDDKPGFIPGRSPILLRQLGVGPGEWLATVNHLQRRYELAVGSPQRLMRLARRWGKQWLHGMAAARQLYPVLSG